MPKVSVIIPNYNHANYLIQRIDSVLNQSYQDFEVIILDDCSTDNSSQVIDSYRGHPKVSEIIFNKTNSGSTFKQWEKGIALANGEFIWIAESDDWCEPTLLQELVHGLNMDQNCVISYCQSYCVQNDNIINWQSQHPYLSELVEGSAFIKKYMLTNNTIFNASMVLWRKEYFHQVSTAFMDYKLCGDWYFWVDLCRLGKVHISGRVLNYFRKHDKDVSGEAMRSGLNYVETLKIINIFYQRNLISKTDYYKAFKLNYRSYHPIKDKLDPQMKKQIEELFRNPLTSKSMHTKIVLGTYWKSFRRR